MTETQNEIEDNFSYGGFWKRTWAYFLDTIVVVIVVLPISFLNISVFKSFTVYLLTVVIAILYKPLMEYYKGYTIGKKALDLKVTNINFSSISLKQAFARNILQIWPILFYIPSYYLAFNNPTLMSVNSFMDFSEQFSIVYPDQKYLDSLSFLLIITEIIFILSDRLKKRRALHDLIAETFVVNTNQKKSEKIPISVNTISDIPQNLKYTWERLSKKHIIHLAGIHSLLGIIVVSASYFGIQSFFWIYFFISIFLPIWQTNTLTSKENKREFHFQSRLITTIFIVLVISIRKYILFDDFNFEELSLLFFVIAVFSGLSSLLIYILPFKFINDKKYYFINYTRFFSPVLIVLVAIIFSLKIGGINLKDNVDITWNDLKSISFKNFQGMPPIDSDFDAGIRSFISYKFSLDNRVLFIDATMSQNLSWVKKKHANDSWLLKHETYHFNITEMITRKTRKEVYNKLSNGGNKHDILAIIKKNSNLLEETQDLYDTETEHGVNEDLQSIWENRIDSTLYFLDPYWTSNIFNKPQKNDKIKYFRNISMNDKNELVGINLLMPNEEKYANHYKLTYNNENKLKEINYFSLGKRDVDDYFEVSTIKIDYDSVENYSWTFYDEKGDKMLAENDFHKQEFISLSEDDVVIKYYDINNNRIPTNFGAFYSRVKLDSLGRIIEKTFYNDKDEQVITENGYCIRKYYYSDESSFSTWDENFDLHQKPLNSKKNGFKTIYSYNDDGNLTLYSSINVDGSYVLRDGGEKKYYEYDELGRVISVKLVDKNEDLMEDEFGIAKYDYSYDRYGFINIKKFYNSNNVLTSNTSGYAIAMDKYNKEGKIISKAFYDTGFMLYFDEDVNGKIIYKYDSLGREIMTYNINGYNQPFRNEFRSGIVVYKYDSLNRVKLALFLNESFKVDTCNKGVSAYKNSYDKKGNLIEVRYYGKNFKLKNSNEDVAIYKYKYDDEGNKIETRYFTKDGKPSNTVHGAFINTYKYLNKQLIERAYYDTAYNLIEFDGYAKKQWDYDERGNVIELRLFNDNNSLTTEGTAIYKYKYDINNNEIEVHEFNHENKSIQLKKSFYEGSLFVGEAYYSDVNIPIEIKGIFRYQFFRDERGNIIEEKSFDKKGILVADTEDGYASIKNQFDFDDNTISQSYFDEFGKPLNIYNKYFTLKFERDNSGHIVKRYYYNSKGDLSEDKDGFALYTYYYNRNGVEIESNKYNKEEASKLLNKNKREETDDILKTTFKL